MNRLWRRLTLVALDVIAAIAAVLVAFVVRFALDDRNIPVEAVVMYLRALPVIIPVRILIFYAFGLYRQMWTHASIPELLRVLWAVTIDSMVSATVILVLPHAGFPRSVLIIGWFLAAGTLGTIRRKRQIMPTVLPVGI